jgi:hypothetical protein
MESVQCKEIAMKWLSFVVVLGLLVGLSGCGESTEVKGSGDKSLKLTVPSSVNITQGETKKFTVKVGRKKFDEPVNVSFSDLPEGVKVEESDTKIDKGVNDREFTLKADEKAPVKENHHIKVKATGGGMTAGEEFTVNVKQKK